MFKFFSLSHVKNINASQGPKYINLLQRIFLVTRQTARMQFLCMNPSKGKDHHCAYEKCENHFQSTIIDVAAKLPHHHCWVKISNSPVVKGKEFLYKMYMQTFHRKTTIYVDKRQNKDQRFWGDQFSEKGIVSMTSSTKLLKS